MLKAVLLAVAAALGGYAIYSKLVCREEENPWAIDPEQQPADEPVPASEEEPEDEPPAAQEVSVEAEVTASCRAMEITTLTGASRVTFRLADGTSKKMYIPGDSGVYLKPGDRGTLVYANDVFICFEQASGAVVGAMYYIPAEQPEEENE